MEHKEESVTFAHRGGGPDAAAWHLRSCPAPLDGTQPQLPELAHLTPDLDQLLFALRVFRKLLSLHQLPALDDRRIKSRPHNVRLSYHQVKCKILSAYHVSSNHNII